MLKRVEMVKVIDQKNKYCLYMINTFCLLLCINTFNDYELN